MRLRPTQGSGATSVTSNGDGSTAPSSWGTGLVVGTAAVGVLLRLRQFLAGRSLWVDEAYVAESIQEMGPFDLVTSPLLNNQRAPAGFLLTVDLSATVLGETDDALRAPSLIAGCLAVVLAVVLARRTLRTVVGQLVLVGAVSFSPVLIYYSSELKQYTFDVAATLAVLVANTAWDEGRGWRKLAVVGAIGLWFSHVVLLVMAVVWLLRVHEARGGLTANRPLVHLTVTWGVFAALFGAQVLATNEPASGDFLADFWRESFAPIPTSVDDLRWYRDAGLDLVHVGFRHEGIAGPPRPFEWNTWTDLLLGVVIASAVVVAVRRRHAIAIPALVVAGAVLASALEVYPFAGRLVLYLLPIVFLVMAVAVEEAASTRPARLGVTIAAAVVLAPTVATALSIGLEPDDSKDMESALAFIETRLEEGDAIALDDGSRQVFEFYADEAGLDDVAVVHVPDDFDPDGVLRAVNDQGVERVWAVVTHRSFLSQPLFDGLGARATSVVRRDSPEARVALFTFDG